MVGRVTRGSIRPNQQVVVSKYDGEEHKAKVGLVYGYLGLERHEVPQAKAGDIIAITGVENLQISDTLCDRSAPEALPALTVDEPTISMTFRVNNSPFAGREGKYLTSRQLRERLFDSLVSLRDKRGENPHLGLGLYIVRLVAAAHGGSVTARNLPGDGGVEFRIHLPRSPGQRTA